MRSTSLSWKCASALLPVVMFGGAQAAPLAQRGEVVFSELMIAPSYHKSVSDSHEWVEVYSRAGQAVSLEGCILREGASGTCTINGESMVGHCYTLKGSGGPLEIAPEAVRLFALNADDLANNCGITADLDYTTLGLNNSGSETLELWCAPTGVHEVVASITYKWDSVEGAQSGRSWMLEQGVLQSGDATDPDSWCVAPDEALSCQFTLDTTTYTEYGTPGAANVCPVPPPPPPRPDPGDVIFTELEVWPTSSSASPEWIELLVMKGDEEGVPNDLDGCQLGVMNCTSSGYSDEACLSLEAPVFTTRTTLETTAGTFLLETGDTVLLVASTEAECVAFDPIMPTRCLVYGEMPYSEAFSLASTDTRMLELSCPDDTGVSVPVDRMLFSGKWVSNECRQENGRCSWELNQESLDPGLNDDPCYWSAAVADSAYFASYSEESGAVEAYGTPGDDNLVGPCVRTSVPAPGEVVITELAIWPTTSTVSADWVELKVLVPPARDVFDLSLCVMRSETCPEESADCIGLEVADADWTSGAISPIGDALWAVAGDRLLLGRDAVDTCVAGDGQGQCLKAVDGSFASVDLTSTGARVLEFACPDETGLMRTIDRVVYAKSWVDRVCTLESTWCSWELRETGADGDGSPIDAYNDNPVHWTAGVSPYLEPAGDQALGTPGDLNTVPLPIATGGMPGPGDVAFSELMLAQADGTPEWLELQAVRAGDEDRPLELAGCQLLLAGEIDLLPDDSTNALTIEACTPDLPGGCDVYHVPDTLSFPLEVGVPRLLVKGEPCLSYGAEPPDEGDDAACLIPADLQHDGLEFSPSAHQAVSLWCPDPEAGWQEIDRLEYDWDDVEEQCPNGEGESLAACSLSVHQDHLDALENDDPYHRCVSPIGVTFYDVTGGLNSGTPGEVNQCPALISVPPEGAIVFTEIMVAPDIDEVDSDSGAFANEWFEVYNSSDTAWNFSVCSFLVGGVLADGSIDLESLDAYAQDSNPVVIEPGEIQVWAKKGCLFGYHGACGADEEDGGGLDDAYPADAAYASMSFTNSDPHVLMLQCAGAGGVTTTVDSIVFNGEYSLEGHSWQLEPEKLNASDNDLPENWCEAPFEASIWTFELSGLVNYGTPGLPNKCGEGPAVTDWGPSCRCDARGGQPSSPGHFGLALLSLGALLLRRRGR